METNRNIEKDIENALGVTSKITPVDVPAFFTERTMQRMRIAKQEQRLSGFSILKVAVIVVLVCVNAYTISKLVSDSPAQTTDTTTNVSASMDDLVNDYQVTDASAYWLNNNKIAQNEQP